MGQERKIVNSCKRLAALVYSDQGSRVLICTESMLDIFPRLPQVTPGETSVTALYSLAMNESNENRESKLVE